MVNGIIIMGLNGCGKSTLSLKLAELLDYKRMDVEDYYFIDSPIPYSVSRSKEEVMKLMEDDIKKYGNYVLSSVGCNWGPEITETFCFAVFLDAPLEIRLERIKNRENIRFGKRVLVGGDMHDSQNQFHNMVVSRKVDDIREQFYGINCPILEVDATLAADEILNLVYKHYKGMILKREGLIRRISVQR